MNKEKYDPITIYICFVLFVNGKSVRDIASIIEDDVPLPGKLPSKSTINNWSRLGYGTEDFPWGQIRDAVKPYITRAMQSEAIARKRSKSTEQWIEDTLSDIDEMQDSLKLFISSMEFRPSDLANLAKARAMINEMSGEQYKREAMVSKKLGEILQAVLLNASSLFPADKKIQGVIDYVGEETAREFINFVNEGCSVDYEPKPAKPSSRRISDGD